MGYFNSIYSSDLSHRAKTVYIYLRDRSDASGVCWPGIKTIASELKLSRSTVKRALEELYQAGLVTRERRWRKNGSCTSNLYRLVESSKK